MKSISKFFTKPIIIIIILSMVFSTTNAFDYLSKDAKAQLQPIIFIY